MNQGEFDKLVKDVNDVFYDCRWDDGDLFGCSILDLMADNFPSIRLMDLKKAIVAADLLTKEQRFLEEIDGYKADIEEERKLSLEDEYWDRKLHAERDGDS